MFCVSDHFRPIYYHHHRRQLYQPPPPKPNAFIPVAYDQQPAVAWTMMSLLPSAGRRQPSNYEPASVLPFQPFSSSTLGECHQKKASQPSPSRLHKLSPRKLNSTMHEQRGGGGAATVKCRDAAAAAAAVAATLTSFRIADILELDAASSDNHRRSPGGATTSSIVRPWDEHQPPSCSASPTSSTSPHSEPETRERDDDDDDMEELEDAAEIDVDDVRCSLTPSDTASNHDVCPLGALLRMTNQTKFDECANRLQQCFADAGQYKHTSRRSV